MPPELKAILQKWIKHGNNTDYLLIDTNGNKLNSVKLNQRMNAIFGGKIATNQLRHTYLTDRYAETSKMQKALEKDMQEMGSSTKVAKNYIKLV